LEEVKNARRTRRNTKVVRVTLDNGATIVCTPDHPFMLRDGSFRRAEELTQNDSLMPLYRKLSDSTEPGITIDGYEMVLDPSSNYWLYTHVLADWYNRWKKVYQAQQQSHKYSADEQDRAFGAPQRTLGKDRKIVL
jgi:DNA gyrase subunit B